MTDAFYVVSYGGSGSWMLVNFLKGYGSAYHIHDRRRPPYHSKVVGESFGRVRERKAVRPRYVFIYSKPQHSILSRNAWGVKHWRNIGVPEKVIRQIPRQRREYGNLQKDLVDYLGFWNNWATPDPDSCWSMPTPVVCVDYHRLWENVPTMLSLCGIDGGVDFPKKREPHHGGEPLKDANGIFRAINEKIDRSPPVFLNL